MPSQKPTAQSRFLNDNLIFASGTVSCNLELAKDVPIVPTEEVAERFQVNAVADHSYAPITKRYICSSSVGTPRSSVLVLGNQLLLEIDAAYPTEVSRKYKVREHTVAAVSECLIRLKRPSAEWTARLPDGMESALDVFVGYVILDALIANQDRHHENWAAIWSPDGRFRHDDVLPLFRRTSLVIKQINFRTSIHRRGIPMTEPKRPKLMNK